MKEKFKKIIQICLTMWVIWFITKLTTFIPTLNYLNHTVKLLEISWILLDVAFKTC